VEELSLTYIRALDLSSSEEERWERKRKQETIAIRKGVFDEYMILFVDVSEEFFICLVFFHLLILSIDLSGMETVQL